MNLLLNKRKAYLLLLPLFAVALFYQVTYSVVVFRGVANPSTELDIPFTSDDGTASNVSDRAAKAGLHAGDKILRIDGREIRNDRDFFRSLHTDASRAPLTVVVLPKGKSEPQLIRIPAGKAPPRGDLMDRVVVVLLTTIMLFCVVVGIYPALILPYDPRALAFFGLMLGTSQVIQSAQWYDFPQSLQFFASAYRVAPLLTWPIWLVLFGLYFPQRFNWDIRRPWIKWIFLGPLMTLACLTIAAASSSYFTYHSWPGAVLNALHIHSVDVFAALSLGIFFASVGTKLAITKDRDARRRLRILLAGCVVSLGPLIVLLVYQRLTQRSVSQASLIPICFLFCVFPATLAYAIVVERAMDLRMVIRQGVRYTLAKGGLGVLLALVAAAVFWGLSVLLIGRQSKGVWSMAIYVAIVIAGVVLIRTTRKRLMDWVDRRFFREAYNAQLILEDLSENVHSIVDEKQMLETVAKRISQSLHVPQFAFLLNGGQEYRPVYCLGFEPWAEAVLIEDSKTVELVKTSKDPAPIYFDREDNWIYSTPETELLTLKSLHAQLLLPLGSKSRLLGIISLGQKLSEEPYSRSDLQLLRSVATQTGLALENSRLTKTVAMEMAQREKLNREIEIAREVQERLFPQRLPVIAGIDYYGACRPALGVGGDYYDFLTLANGDLGVAIGDVSGKGIAAALLMASLQASLRGQALMGPASLAQLMMNVNQLVYEATPINRYATFFYGQFHRESGLFRYVNAGHNPPIILRYRLDTMVHVIRLETGGPVVGLFPGAPYQEGSLILQPGDLFLGFTDGISEAMNKDEEEWGEERLIPAVAAHARERAVDIVPGLIADADRFVSGAPQHDDMTLVVLKVGG